MWRKYDNDDVPLRTHASGFPSLNIVERVTSTCIQCGATFEYKKQEKPKEFCSRSCSAARKDIVKQQIKLQISEAEWKERQETERREKEDRERVEKERADKLAQERKPTIDRLRAEGKSWNEIAQYFKEMSRSTGLDNTPHATPTD